MYHLWTKLSFIAIITILPFNNYKLISLMSYPKSKVLSIYVYLMSNLFLALEVYLQMAYMSAYD